MENIMMAFGLTLFAGLSTGIGSLIALLAKTTNKKFLSAALGFSAGVMIYVSLVEILFKAKNSLSQTMGEKTGSWLAVLAFFSGMFIIACIDRLVPSADNPHEVRGVERFDGKEFKDKRLYKTGLRMALAIAIHNFPEGIATFMAAMHDPKIAVPVAVAIAIHNIPEGISVSVPVYYATGSRKKAFVYSFLSGISEPIGALVGFTLLRQFAGEIVFGFTFAAVAGIMIFICLDELLPAAEEYGEHHISIYGVVAGMIVMSVSLLLFI